MAFSIPSKAHFRKRPKYPRSLYCLFLCTILCVIVYFLLYREIGHAAFVPDMHITKRLILRELSRSVMMEKGTGCQMPEVDPFSEEAKKYIKKVPKIECKGIDWVECYKDECYVLNHTSLENMDIQCTYRDIVHMSDDSYFLEEPITLKRNIKYKLLRSDNVKVSCIGRKLTGIDIIPVRWFGYKAGLRPILNKTAVHLEHLPNVLFVVIDSASKAGFMRLMPKSYKMLTQQQFVILNSYNIIGSGPTATIFPILAGRMQYEFPDYRKYADSDAVYFNSSYFIFEELSKLGYRTAFLEDMPWLSTFQQRFNGFSDQPTDHYIYSLMMAEFKNGKKRHMGMSERYCIGATPLHSMMINLTDQFIRLPGKKFGFILLNSVGHDGFNFITEADDELADFFKKLHEDKIMEDSVVIVMGDHGSRYSEYRKTYQGKIEERLPLMAIRLPDKLHSGREYRNLVSNTNVLTTAFDVNAMVLDLLQLRHMKNNFKVAGTDLSRAISLIDRIPESRACGEAGIQPHFCACSKWYHVPADDPLYKRVAYSLLNFTNDLPSSVIGYCAKRTLIEINKVQRFSPNKMMLQYKKSYDIDGLFPDLTSRDTGIPRFIYFQAIITVTPHRSVFEGTVTYDTSKDIITVKDKDISRLDSYADESGCLFNEQKHYMKYCSCYSLFVNHN